MSSDAQRYADRIDRALYGVALDIGQEWSSPCKLTCDEDDNGRELWTFAGDDNELRYAVSGRAIVRIDDVGALAKSSDIIIRWSRRVVIDANEDGPEQAAFGGNRRRLSTLRAFRAMLSRHKMKPAPH